ncbi:MAG: outer membrane beta-barrel protein [Myxococcota bacterium]
MMLSAAILSVGLFSAQAPTSTQLGVKVGEKSRVHADVTTSVLYDSNVDRLDTNRNPNDLDGSDGRVVVTPGLELDVPGRKLQLFMRAEGSINHRFGLNSRPQQTLAGFRGIVGAEVGARQAPVALRVRNTIIRTPTLIGEPGTILEDEQVFTAWTNVGRVGLVFRPGGGALEISTTYLNQLQIFDDDSPVDGGALPDTQTHGAELDVRYSFLPKTAAFLTTELSVFDVLGDDTALGQTQTAAPFRVVGGVSGQVSRRLSAEIAAGYGNVLVFDGGAFSSVDNQLNRETVIARTRLRYDVSSQARLTLSFARIAEPILVEAAVVRNRGEFRADAMVASRLLLNALVAYENRNFSASATDANVVIGDAGAEMFVLPWLSFLARYRVFFQDANDDDLPPPFLGDFTRHQIIGAARARY